MFLNFFLGAMELFLLICLLCFLIYILTVIPLYRYLRTRLKNDELGDGFIGVLTVIPKFLGIINVFYSIFFVLRIVVDRHHDILPPEHVELLLQISLIDYVIWGIIFTFMIISIEIIRFIEYKVCFDINGITIYLDKSDDCWVYNNKKIPITSSEGDVISLKIEPTLHGEDSIHGSDIEYIIKKNRTIYCFTNT